MKAGRCVGLGAGGHCIPVDPVYLQVEARRIGAASSLLDAALRANSDRAEVVAAHIAAHYGGALGGRHILVAGVCYKPEVADIRCSAAVRLLRVLAAAGAAVCWHDPVIGEAPAELFAVPRCASLSERFDAVVLGVPHRAFTPAALAGAAPLVFDPFGVLPRGVGVVSV